MIILSPITRGSNGTNSFEPIETVDGRSVLGRKVKQGTDDTSFPPIYLHYQ